MGHFVELVLEFLFGLAKDSPDKMPSVNYIDSFVIRHPRKKTLVRICATLVLIVVFSVLWFLVKHETRFLFVIFAVWGFILLVLSVFSFSFECYVNDIITWAMPGYNDPVIMAAGAFTQGSSIELSADGPLRPPYTAFFQGGLTYESGKLAIMSAADAVLGQ